MLIMERNKTYRIESAGPHGNVPHGPVSERGGMRWDGKKETQKGP